jgi:hypothetical protein
VPRKLMSEFCCSRCSRTWYVEVDPNKPMPEAPSLVLELKVGEEVISCKYDELCSSCAQAVKNYVTGVVKELKGKSPSRKVGAKKGGEVDVGSTPTPPSTPDPAPGEKPRKR